MLAAMAFAAALDQEIGRPVSQDIHCAALVVLASETVQARPNADPADKAAMAAMMLYFLGRVEAAIPQGEDAARSIIEAAGGLSPSAALAADLQTCGQFMQDQSSGLTDEARRRGRALR